VGHPFGIQFLGFSVRRGWRASTWPDQSAYSLPSSIKRVAIRRGGIGPADLRWPNSQARKVLLFVLVDGRAADCSWARWLWPARFAGEADSKAAVGGDVACHLNTLLLIQASFTHWK